MAILVTYCISVVTKIHHGSPLLTRVNFNSSPLEQNCRHFGRRRFKCIFLNENRRIPIQTSPKFVPRSPIGSGNGLAPNRRQAIIWTNADPVHWRIHTALEGDELIKTWISNYIHYKMWDESLIHSKISTAQPLKFGYGDVISSHTLQYMRLLIMLGLKLIHVSKTGPDDRLPVDEIYYYATTKSFTVTWVNDRVPV